MFLNGFFFKHVKYEMGLINRREEIEGIFKKNYRKEVFLYYNQQYI
jgi:hypothetical protein